ncbi:transcription repressor NadR [Alkalihalophilus pseudofirmus]|uniref:transcription repressor NadR n=1 Tax=Alkalihalobacterium alkalinitrilicum TaxID=427920 RepID=UPI00094D5E66|nr:transcription repressor NadR [Alkalihalobacterium alkalinitrilicum]OLO36470.1 transcription repressor NadR [Alkalihalophilus pseudofirmus]
MTTKKILGEERRKLILSWLKSTNTPITGNDLAEKTGVSRQVIVQDISILKARNHPLIATAQGYMFIKPNHEEQTVRQVIACKHHPNETEEELLLLVDHRVTVRDVMIEHPIYGDLTGSLMLNNRHDVLQFTEKMRETKAVLLSELTEGVHLHTIEADRMEHIEAAVNALKQRGFLLN